jgi:hypothetical protein
MVEAHRSVLKELAYYCAITEAFKDSENIFYLPAKYDQLATVKHLLCYLKDINGTLCYDVLEPFALVAAKLMLEKAIEHSSESSIRVLSLDGGGVRGIIEACILEEIEKRSGKRVCLFCVIISHNM